MSRCRSPTGLAVAFILAVIFSWNNFVFGIVLAGRETRTLPVAVYNMISFDQGELGAAGGGRPDRDLAGAAADGAGPAADRRRADRGRRRAADGYSAGAPCRRPHGHRARWRWLSRREAPPSPR